MTQKFIDLLQNLVQIPSPSHQEADATAYLVNWMAQEGFTAEVDSVGNAVGSKGTGPNEIILLGHIDTFPGSPPVHRKGDVLYGRGSVDAKGPLCTFAAAVSTLTPPPDWRLTVVGAVEEEVATSKGARHILKERTANPPCYCIIGEPSEWDRVTLGYKGRLLLNIDLQIPFSHSAGPGTLPAEQGIKLWQTIQTYIAEMNIDRKGVFNTIDPSVRAFNTYDEGTFGKVAMSLGFRLPLDVFPKMWAAELCQVILTQQLSEPEDMQSNIDMSFSGHEMAYKAEKSTPLVRAFLKAIRANGGKPRFVVKTGTSDMNIVGPVWNCPILAYGPGDSSLDHTPHEHLNLQTYLTAIKVLQATLLDLMSPG